MIKKHCVFLCLLSTFFFASLSYAAPSQGERIYQQSCAGCHETGTANAPRRLDNDFWQKRLQEVVGPSALVHDVIYGKGAMPPKGGCATCTEDQLRDAVAYMLENAQANTKPEVRSDLPLDQLILQPGFNIEIYADDLPGSRTLAMSDAGVIFVGTRGHGNVYALIPAKNPGEKMRSITLLSGLNEPNGVAYHDGDLYVAEIHRILKYENVDQHLDKMPAPIVVNDTLPKEKWHGYRVIQVGPDNHLYIAMGMPCNTCDYRKTQPLFGTIARMSLDGKNLTPYAIGVRNSIGFAWHPNTQELWFTDNGQDLLGDDTPPDEINRAYKAGLDFGFPYMYGDNTLAPGYGNADIKDLTFEKPAFKLQAHVAPLGMVFYQDKILVALHGSWNRSKKVGYEVIELTLKNNQVTEMKPFVTGWLQGQAGWGRPVDFLVMPDGALLITDDLNGLVYRVSRPQIKSGS